MCSIVGALSFTNSSFRVSEPYLVRMRDVMSHRGPDGAGIFLCSMAKMLARPRCRAFGRD
jgi:asparagine synthetase B (glutamine-hydrolysing)